MKQFTPRMRGTAGAAVTVWRSWLLCALLCAAPCVLGAPLSTTLDAGASVRFDDNHSNAPDSRDREADAVWRLELLQLRRPGREEGDRLAVAAAIGVEKFADFDDLDRADASVRVGLSLLPGTGYGAPSLDVGLRGEARRHRDSSIRDGFLGSLFLHSSTRLTDRLTLATTLDLTQRTATSGAVFDTRTAGLLTRADLSLSRRNLLWLEVRATTGDLTSTVATSGARLFPQAEALEVDDAFGPGLLSPGPGPAPGPAPGPGPGPANGDRIAYRLDGESLGAAAGWLHTIGPQTTVETSVGYRRAAADDGVRYDNLTAALFLLHRLR